MDEHLKNWIRFGGFVESFPEGGSLLPKRISVKKQGVVAWFFRLINDERGWKYVSIFADNDFTCPVCRNVGAYPHGGALKCKNPDCGALFR